MLLTGLLTLLKHPGLLLRAGTTHSRLGPLHQLSIKKNSPTGLPMCQYDRVIFSRGEEREESEEKYIAQ